jgi:hypothetical protein
MHREMLLRHLDQNERHLAHGVEHIAKQRLLVEELARHGHDTTVANELLNTLLESQRLHEQDHARIASSSSRSTCAPSNTLSTEMPPGPLC